MVKKKALHIITPLLKVLGLLVFSLALGLGLGYFLVTYLNFDIVHREGTVSSEVSRPEVEEDSGKLPLIEDTPIKNIILFIGDGMGLGQIAATRYRYLGPEGRLSMERMPVTGLINTFAADHQLITDSGAGATALATGYKTDIGMIGVTPDGQRHKSIMEVLQERGFSTGLVTTSDITDATPGAFSSHVLSRKKKEEIVKQLIDSQVNLLVSGGETYHGKELEGEERISVIKYAQNNGFDVIHEKQEFFDTSENHILALFEGMAADKFADAVKFNEEAPALRECTAKAIDLLQKNTGGFFLMVEEEGIDSGSHINRIDFVTSHLKNFDDAVTVALDFALKNKQTLVLVLADHETGGLTLVKDNSSKNRIGVRWSTDGHTGQPVPLFAFGPHASAFTGVLDNTDVPKIIAELFGIDDFPPRSEK
jgi:alkaline phosphatase